jgi:S1-C subfamily serine protease
VAAIILACIAIATIQRTQERGIGMAICGLLLGFVDVVAWIILIVMWQGPGANHIVRRPEMDLDPAALKSVDPFIADAMRANVVISSQYRLDERMGSGVVLKIDKGVATIVTNRHVIDSSYNGDGNDSAKATEATLFVRMVGQPATEGKLEWVAPSGVDLAIVSVNCKSAEVRAAKYPSPSAPKLGDPAFAVGNPHALGWSLSPGTVSQVRKWQSGKEDLIVIQTTAPINSGNSGGGLYDKEGYVVGINTWTEDKQVSEGIGFAISMECLLRLAPPNLLAAPAEVKKDKP